VTKDSLNLLGAGLLFAFGIVCGVFLAGYHKVVIVSKVCPEGKMHVITDGKLWDCIGGYLR